MIRNDNVWWVCNGCHWKTTCSTGALWQWLSPILANFSSEIKSKHLQVQWIQFHPLMPSTKKQHIKIITAKPGQQKHHVFPAWLITTSPAAPLSILSPTRALGVSGGHKTSETLKVMLPKCHGSRLAPTASLARYSLATDGFGAEIRLSVHGKCHLSSLPKETGLQIQQKGLQQSEETSRSSVYDPTN